MELTLSGPAGGDTRRYPLAVGETVIGRRPDCRIVLDAPSISPRHVRLFVVEGSAVLYSLDDTWPVHVNGSPVRRRELAHGDEIELGPYRLRFADPAADHAGAPAHDDAVDTEDFDSGPVPETLAFAPPAYHLDILSGINRGRRVALNSDLVVLGFDHQRLVELRNDAGTLSLRRLDDDALAHLNGAELTDEPTTAMPGDVISLQRIELRIHQD